MNGFGTKGICTDELTLPCFNATTVQFLLKSRRAEHD